MWRIYKILCYLREYLYREDAEQFDWCKLQQRGINEEDFKNFLLYQKRYLESWKSRFLCHQGYFYKLCRRFLHRHFGLLLSAPQKGLKKEQDRLHKIDLAIEGSIKREYLNSDNQCLKFTEKGLRLSRSWGIFGMVFWNECLKEYSVMTIFIGSISIVSLLRLFWRWINPLLSRWLGL